MPLSTVLNPPEITWPYRVSWPGGFDNRRSQENFRSFNDQARLAQVGVGAVTGSGGAETGSSGGDFFDMRDGVSCIWTTTAPRATGWSFPWWTPYLDGSALPVGTRVPEGAVVAVLDTMFLTGYAAGGDADMVGTWIGGALDSSSAANIRNNTPGGASPGVDTGGAGFLVDPAGTGYDFVSWGLGGAVANRVAVPATLTEWNSFRFVLTSAFAGGAATLSVYHNGTLLLTDTYGSATLPFPYNASGGAVGDPAVPMLAFSGLSVTPPIGWGYRFDAKFGRFSLDGVALQDE